MSLHLITGQYVGQGANGIGQYDTSLTGLSMLYGVSVAAIQNANFGGTSLEQLYTWLSENGGEPQAADPSVPTGRHWSFRPGMVIDIPGKASKSPPPENEPVEPAGPTTPGVEPGAPVVSQASMGGGGLTTWLILGVAVYFLMNGGKKGKKRRKTKKRKTTRRRRRY